MMSTINPKNTVPTDRESGILNRQPSNTNYAFASNFHLSIPKIRLGTYFCTEVGFPEMTCEPVRLQVPFAPSLKFFGDKVTHGDLTVKFIINEDYSNYNQMNDWFKNTLVYEDFFKTGTDLGFSAMTNIGHLLILSNKKNPVARFRFNGMFITNLTSIDYNSALTDASIATATATFQFSSYDLDDI